MNRIFIQEHPSLVIERVKIFGVCEPSYKIKKNPRNLICTILNGHLIVFNETDIDLDFRQDSVRCIPTDAEPWQPAPPPPKPQDCHGCGAPGVAYSNCGYCGRRMI